MIIALSILMVIAFGGMTFTTGFFIGKGKIEIQRKLTDEEKRRMEEIEHQQNEAIEKFNKGLHAIVNFTDMDGDD